MARSIDEEMKKGKDFMSLILSQAKKMILKSFPAIHEKCLSFGFDITKEKYLSFQQLITLVEE